MLCEICLDIFRGSCPVKYTLHHSSVESLQRSALEDCEICRVLWTWISRQSQLGREHADVATVAYTEFDGDDDLNHFLVIHPFPPLDLRERFYAYKAADEDYKDPDADKSHDYPNWTGRMTCARTWLADCVEKHPDCPASRPSQYISRDNSEVSEHTVTDETETHLPTRLIEIGQPEADRVRLRLRSELDSTSSHYATLSHCWGTSKCLRLTADSFQRLRNGVRILELAKTFQDAIFTASSLDIKFLWIDSFCVFQDSKEDWQQESALMSRVYRHSLLNIAASIATDSEAGCFHERSSTVEPCVVQTTWTDRPNGTCYVYYDSFWEDNFDHMPLNHRAWVVQELALAPRVIHLCGSQMFWECHGLSACETWPSGLPFEMYNLSIRSNRWAAAMKIFGSKRTGETRPLRISPDNNVGLDTLVFRSMWSTIVEEYSKCDLTFPSDKLVALSGIAKHIGQLLDIEYCAGLWEFDLVAGLAWYLKKENDKNILPPTEANPVTYRAPSWSWACLDGPIIPYRPQWLQQHHLVDIIGCDIKTATADRTGAVVDASIQLTGHLATMNLHPDFEEVRDIYFDKGWNTLTDLPPGRLSLDRRPSSSQLHCLPILSMDPYLCALLLIPTGSKRGQFQRVGIFYLQSLALGLKRWKSFSEFENESWLEYESIGDDGRCTITIV